MILVAATNNKNKLREFKEIFGCDVFSAGELGADADPEETGKTFAENAEIKASEIYKMIRKLDKLPDKKYWVVADDSGLCVDALDGAPGIYSARYASTEGINAGDFENTEKLLKDMESVPDDKRGAHFACSICAINEDGKMIQCEGKIFGVITRERRGENGFGYDPVFYVPEFSKTTAELSPEEKNKISHRGKAVRELKKMIWS